MIDDERSSFRPSWIALPLDDPSSEGFRIEKALLPIPPSGVRSHERRGPQVALDPAIRVRDDLVGRTVGDDATVPEQQDTVRMRQCKVHVVRDEIDTLEPGDGQHLADEALGGADDPAPPTARQGSASTVAARARWPARDASAARMTGRAAVAPGCSRDRRAMSVAGRRRSAHRRSRGRVQGSSGRTRAPRGPFARTASGLGSGKRSRTWSRARPSSARRRRGHRHRSSRRSAAAAASRSGTAWSCRSRWGRARRRSGFGRAAR